MKDLTLEDIAKLAGVSRSTVSRVVNDHPNVKGAVRRRVQEVIKDTGYHPNAAARALASQRSSMLGLVLPRTVSSFFTDPYFPRLAQGIAQACNQYDYTLGLFLVSNREDEEKMFPRISHKGLLDGILVQSGQIVDQLIERLQKSNIPLVIIGRPFSSPGVSYIDVDNVSAAYNAVSHLIRLGYQRIATITGPINRTESIDRLEGYFKALREHDMAIDPALQAEGDFSEVSGYNAMQQLFAAQPQAVFAASDMTAVGAIRAARGAGLRIPEDIAFVGFDDLPLPKLNELKLTTVRQQIDAFGFRAVEVLIDVIENGLRPPRRVIFDTELIVRESCGSNRAAR